MRKIRLQKAGSDQLRERFARELNESQLQAATAPDGFNLILAGPGSGKTRVITYRVAYLIARGVPADKILLVTFTRRAAREMVGRLETLVGPRAAQVWAGTFHHIGNRILAIGASAGPLAHSPSWIRGPGATSWASPCRRPAWSGPASTPRSRRSSAVCSASRSIRGAPADVVADRAPTFASWIPQIEEADRIYRRRKGESNCVDYDDLLGLWLRLVEEFPEQRAAQGRMFDQILVDEMQDTNALQVSLVESIARAGAGNLTAVGDDAQSIYRFRGAEYANILEFAGRNPEARVFQLAVNYRSTPEIVAFTAASIARNATGFPKAQTAARPSGPKPLVVPAADVYEEAEFLCQQILDTIEQGISPTQIAVLYRSYHDSVVLQGELTQRGIPYAVRGGLRFFEQAHIKDVLGYMRLLVNPRDELAWRRVLQLLPGVGPAKASAIWEHLAASADPLAAMAQADTMGKVPTRSRGAFAAFVADLWKIRKTDPAQNPAAAIGAILQTGYVEVVKTKYERPENRLADIEQLGVLAARYDSLEKLVADLLLAGEVQGMDASADEEQPAEHLMLSTIHQAKGLEWSRVFIPRLVEDSFPSGRALAEDGGEEEERRIFYVAVSRAMDELFLTYPLTLSRGGRGPTVIATPSRFLTELEPELMEQAVLETDLELAWTSGLKSGENEAPRP
ncbi:MAG: ATP-dependent helicase [Isosphaeraceae bacterium]